ncbi:hypothetical protein AAE478_006442 [Parahypoxylon ruwenzoriense]
MATTIIEGINNISDKRRIRMALRMAPPYGIQTSFTYTPHEAAIEVTKLVQGLALRDLVDSTNTALGIQSQGSLDGIFKAQRDVPKSVGLGGKDGKGRVRINSRQPIPMDQYEAGKRMGKHWSDSDGKPLLLVGIRNADESEPNIFEPACHLVPIEREGRIGRVCSRVIGRPRHAMSKRTAFNRGM